MEARKDPDNGDSQAKARRKKTVGKTANQQEPKTEPASGPIGGRPSRQELTPLQLRGIHALLTQPTMSAAADELGVHPRTISRWLKDGTFRREYREAMTELQAELWHQMLAVRGEGWNRFLELLRSSNDRIRLRATTWYLDKILSVPAMLGQLALEDDVLDLNTSPSLRSFLEEAEAVEHGNEDDAA